MNTLQKEIVETFKIEAKIDNLLEFDVSAYICDSNVFKWVYEIDINKIVKGAVEKDGVLFSKLFQVIKNCTFSDFDRKINITIGTIEQEGSKYNILLDKRQMENINSIENAKTTCVQRLNKVKELSSFFTKELERIKEQELKVIKEQILQEIIQKKSFFSRITQRTNYTEIGFLYFLMQDYSNAKQAFLKSTESEEMIFYCNVMLGVDHTDAFVYYSPDPIINIRRIYFIREYLTIVNNNSLTVYYMLNSFTYSLPLFKLILETELITFLGDFPNFKNRTILALYNCIDITFQENLDDLSIEYIKELKKYKIVPELSIYIDEIKKLISERNADMDRMGM